MKKIFTLLILFIATANVFANYGNTRLSITSLSNADIKVMIDGRNYSAPRGHNEEDFVFENLAAGRHKVEVYSTRIRRSRDGYGNNPRNNGMQLIWSGNIYLRDRYHTDIVINRFGKAFTDEQYIDGYSDYPQGNGRAISDREYESLRRTVSNQSFDNTAMSVLQQAAMHNWFTTDQVVGLVRALKFDDSRLSAAKMLYGRTIDKRSFYRVNEAFSFVATKEDLSRWLLQQPQ